MEEAKKSKKKGFQGLVPQKAKSGAEKKENGSCNKKQKEGKKSEEKDKPQTDTSNEGHQNDKSKKSNKLLLDPKTQTNNEDNKSKKKKSLLEVKSNKEKDGNKNDTEDSKKGKKKQKNMDNEGDEKKDNEHKEDKKSKKKSPTSDVDSKTGFKAPKPEKKPAEPKAPPRNLTDEEYVDLFQAVLDRVTSKDSSDHEMEESEDEKNKEENEKDEKKGCTDDKDEMDSIKSDDVDTWADSPTKDKTKANTSLQEPPKIKPVVKKKAERSGILQPKKLLFTDKSAAKTKPKNNDKKSPKPDKNLTKVDTGDADNEDNDDDDDETGTWVQCTKRECSKWRYVEGIEDPALVPTDWECSMNSDKERNSCESPEVDYDESEHICTTFTIGSIVWAKMAGYPWWPGMIEPDPDFDTYFEVLTEQSMVPYQYHVTFFDDHVTRAWVRTNFITPYIKDKGPTNQSVKHRNTYKKEIQQAENNANAALELSLKERVCKFGFAKRYTTSKTKWHQKRIVSHKKKSKTSMKVTMKGDKKDKGKLAPPVSNDVSSESSMEEEEFSPEYSEYIPTKTKSRGLETPNNPKKNEDKKESLKEAKQLPASEATPGTDESDSDSSSDEESNAGGRQDNCHKPSLDLNVFTMELDTETKEQEKKEETDGATNSREVVNEAGDSKKVTKSKGKLLKLKSAKKEEDKKTENDNEGVSNSHIKAVKKNKEDANKDSDKEMLKKIKEKHAENDAEVFDEDCADGVYKKKYKNKEKPKKTKGKQPKSVCDEDENDKFDEKKADDVNNNEKEIVNLKKSTQKKKKAKTDSKLEKEFETGEASKNPDISAEQTSSDNVKGKVAKHLRKTTLLKASNKPDGDSDKENINPSSAQDGSKDNNNDDDDDNKTKSSNKKKGTKKAEKRPASESVTDGKKLVKKPKFNLVVPASKKNDEGTDLDGDATNDEKSEEKSSEKKISADPASERKNKKKKKSFSMPAAKPKISMDREVPEISAASKDDAKRGNKKQLSTKSSSDQCVVPDIHMHSDSELPLDIEMDEPPMVDVGKKIKTSRLSLPKSNSSKMTSADSASDEEEEELDLGAVVPSPTAKQGKTTATANDSDSEDEELNLNDDGVQKVSSLAAQKILKSANFSYSDEEELDLDVDVNLGGDATEPKSHVFGRFGGHCGDHGADSDPMLQVED